MQAQKNPSNTTSLTQAYSVLKICKNRCHLVLLQTHRTKQLIIFTRANVLMCAKQPNIVRIPNSTTPSSQPKRKNKF